MQPYEFRSCIEACLACATGCRELAYESVDMPAAALLVERCLDCANHCIICCSDLRSNSSLLVHSSRSCAEGCELCAIECAKHKTALTNRCEAACRVCADECLSLAAALAKREARELCRGRRLRY